MLAGVSRDTIVRAEAADPRRPWKTHRVRIAGVIARRRGLKGRDATKTVERELWP